MEMTLQGGQTKARDAHRGLRLPILSPYFQRTLEEGRHDRQEYKTILATMNVNAIIAYSDNTYPGDLYLLIMFFDTSNNYLGVVNQLMSISDIFTNGEAATAIAAVAAAATANSYTVLNTQWFVSTGSQAPMQVSGVSKSGYYPVVAAPVVAGGAGVARFYVDTNGDGTGTAPSEIEIASLQAYVLSSTSTYVPQSFTVDTNKKYVDVKMGALSFTTGLAGILNVVTGANIANAANGTAINCTVFVKK